MKVLLLLLGLVVSVNSAVSRQKRIIGGHDCDDTERLYHVRLVMSNGTHRRFCGGSLIHPKWILTSDTCWASETGWSNVAKFKIHPPTGRPTNYRTLYQKVNYAPEGWSHDIMLVMLQRPVTNVPLAQLPDCSNRPKRGDTVQLAGEGATTTGPNNQRLPNDDTATRLQCVNMNVVEDSHFLLVCGHTFSAAAPNKDACHGDVGSAVVFNGMIYGVISAVVPNQAFQRPDSIADVCGYIEWIRTVTEYK